MSTTEFERVDPLGGILHPNWEKRKANEAARDKRFPVRKVLDGLVARWKADEPNIRTYDTKLEVDEEEFKRPRRTAGEQKRIARAAAVFEGHDPGKLNTEPLSPLFGSAPPKQDNQKQRP